MLMLDNLMKLLTQGIVLAALALSGVAVPQAAQTADAGPPIKTASVGDGIELHYVELGQGTPVIFVHGSLSDFSYWKDQVEAFSRHYRAITYSRRYDFPNTNPVRPGYSAVSDAGDLAALIKTLRLGKVYVVGHSYGALTALFLARDHSELLRALVLAEAPAVSLLAHLPGGQAEVGKATLADIQKRMVAPMRAAFANGDRQAGIRAFMAYVFDDPQAWDKMPASSRSQTLRDAHEWDVMMTRGDLFPTLEPRSIRKISVPALLLSGEKSYPFLNLIDQEVARLLPHGHRLIVRGAGHQMWYQQPELCREAAETFMRQNGGATVTAARPR